jgi:FAD/FMN-containing dehydrogenase
MVGRRQFLVWAAACAAPLAACTAARTRTIGADPEPITWPSPVAAAVASKGASTVASTVPAPTNAPAPITSLSALQRRFSGRLLRPGERSYDSARLSFNRNYDDQRPAVVAQCASIADVQRSLEYAAATKTPLAARSGGHSYAGYSTPSHGVVLDLGAFSSIVTNPDGSVLVGAGVRLIDLYRALARVGRALPGGSCPTVGVGGLTLGGGVGFLSRAHGLTCDHLVSAELVTADSVRHEVTGDDDLAWALRGGGGGNVGVVTALTFRTVALGSVVKFALDFGPGSSVDVLGAWQQWMAGAPDELSASCTVTATQAPSCVVTGLYLGSAAAARTALGRFVRAVGWAPNWQSLATMSFGAAMTEFARCDGLAAAQCAPAWTGPPGSIERSSFVATSCILQAPVDPQAVLDAVTGSDVAVLLDPINAAAGRVPAEATAFPHRDALATVQIYGDGSDRTTINAVRTRLVGLLGNHGYVNYIDPMLPDWRSAYYGSNLARLQGIARRYDPDHVLAFAQNVNA